MAKRTASPNTAGRAAHPHGHKKGRCLDILRTLSAYIDDELSQDICRQIRRHLGACPNCEEFVASLRQTVSLCRHRPPAVLSSADRIRMRDQILKSVRIR